MILTSSLFSLSILFILVKCIPTSIHAEKNELRASFWRNSIQLPDMLYQNSPDYHATTRAGEVVRTYWELSNIKQIQRPSPEETDSSTNSHRDERQPPPIISLEIVDNYMDLTLTQLKAWTEHMIETDPDVDIISKEFFLESPVRIITQAQNSRLVPLDYLFPLLAGLVGADGRHEAIPSGVAAFTANLYQNDDHAIAAQVHEQSRRRPRRESLATLYVVFDITRVKLDTCSICLDAVEGVYSYEDALRNCDIRCRGCEKEFHRGCLDGWKAEQEGQGVEASCPNW